MKTIDDYINTIEMFEDYVEPETIRDLFPQLSEREYNKLMALVSIKVSKAPFENFYVFENVIRAINDVVPDPSLVEGALPKWIWYGVKIMKKLRPEQEFSDEITQYIKRIFADYGIYFYNPELNINNPLLKQVKSIANDEDLLPITDESFKNRQAIHYLSLELYNNINQGTN
tara:strand:- start:1430 stop:1945 length:516 start_codon:yes stop_codon:yes gene_type:complete